MLGIARYALFSTCRRTVSDQERRVCH
jgi:hypothetical protein